MAPTVPISASRRDEYGGAPLLNVSIAFAVIETVVILLFYASRYIQTKSITGLEMTAFMPLGYISCIGNSIVGIREQPQFLLEICRRYMLTIR